MSASRDVISVVEAAYDLDSAPETWLGNLLDIARPLLDRGMGVIAYQFEAGSSPPRVPLVQVRGCDFDAKATLRVVANVPAAIVGRTYLSPRICATASEATGLGDALAELDAWVEVAEPIGMVDSLGIRIAGPRPGSGIMLHAPVGRVARTTRQERRTWGRIAAHIAAGYRLRDALDGRADAPPEAPEPGSIEAVVQTDGRVVHAEGQAKTSRRRETLRRAVVALEQARGPLRRTDSHAALALWRGLAAGRWTLVDSYEEGGRRYVVARQNEPEHDDPRALTPRERQVANLVAQGHSNKLIAYALGLSLSTVGTHVARAKSKLGASSRADLIRHVRATRLG